MVVPQCVATSDSMHSNGRSQIALLVLCRTYNCTEWWKRMTKENGENDLSTLQCTGRLQIVLRGRHFVLLYRELSDK